MHPITWFSALLLMCMGSGPLYGQDQTDPVRAFQPYRTGSQMIVVDTPDTEQVHPGEVTVVVDPAIDKLMQTYRERPVLRQGYRVQIFLGDRPTAENQKRAFLQRHPDVPAYLSWLAPNFRLRVGDLRTRLDAERLLNELRDQFPGSYIVADEIEMPRVL